MKRFDVVIAGEANMDLLLYGLPEALPADRELLAEGMQFVLGGSSAITAHNLAALGNRVGFLALAADDAFARFWRAELENAGVDLSHVVAARAGITTGVSVLLQHAQSRRIFTWPGTTAALRLADLDLDSIASAQHFHLSSYFLQRDLRADVPVLLRSCKEQGLTVSLDPNDDPAGEWGHDLLDLLGCVDVLMPNEHETCRLAGDSDLERAIETLRRKVPLLVVKRGLQGAVAIRGEQRVAMPACSVACVDAVGAGDSFNAGFLHGYLRGWDLERCVRLGNCSGAFSTTGVGGTQAFRDRAALAQFLERHGETEVLAEVASAVPSRRTGNGR
ncbi:MAG TPA: carbohydrate kinase family protein [Acidobacteriaceae bacterium]|nr:carbohydrate kinase family protein [Acidobacteriaceae bacterium]